MNYDKTIDISTETCPLTFIRTKLALEKMLPGQVLEVLGLGQEPRHNVPMAVQDHGHEIIAIEDLNEERFRLLIRVQD